MDDLIEIGDLVLLPSWYGLVVDINVEVFLNVYVKFLDGDCMWWHQGALKKIS